MKRKALFITALILPIMVIAGLGYSTLKQHKPTGFKRKIISDYATLIHVGTHLGKIRSIAGSTDQSVFFSETDPQKITSVSHDLTRIDQYNLNITDDYRINQSFQVFVD